MNVSLLLRILIIIAVLSIAGNGRADDFEVRDIADSGAGSLRDAIVAANGTPGDDTITFDSDLDFEIISLSGTALTITDTTGTIMIDASALPSGIAVDASGTSRVFEIAPGASLEVNNLEISGGQAPDGSDGIAGASPTDGTDGEDGGGIYNEGTLTLRSSTVTFNFAGNGGAGGENQGNDADFSGNGGRGGRGGGIFATGDQAFVLLYDSDVTANEAGAGGNAGDVADGDIGSPSLGGKGGNGGGIYMDDRSNLVIERSKISGNRAGNGGTGGFDGDGGVGAKGGTGGDGGGIAANLPVIEIKDSEIVSNWAGAGGAGGDNSGVTTDEGGAGGDGGNGGGLWIELFGTAAMDKVHISSSLIQQNQAGDGVDGGDGPTSGSNGSEGGKGGDGGGIYIASGKAGDHVWSMENTTVSLNSTGDGGDGGDGAAPGIGGEGAPAGKGGGIAFAAGSEDYTAHLAHLTILSNTTGLAGFEGSPTGGGDGEDPEGGGIWEGDAGGGGIDFGRGVTLANTIVALNDADTDPDFRAGFLEEGNNFVGGNPELDVLIDLGGPTKVIPPIPESPIIDAGGVLAKPLLVDQRGTTRPKGAGPDLGAVEIGFQPDAKVGRRSNPATHRINDVYRASGAGQQLTVKLKGKRTGRAYFSIENDGDIGERPKVRGSRANRTVKLKVFRRTGGRRNVTSALRSGHILEDWGAGDTVVFEVQTKAKSKKKKARQTLRFSATSEFVASNDAVKVKVKQSK